VKDKFSINKIQHLEQQSLKKLVFTLEKESTLDFDRKRFFQFKKYSYESNGSKKICLQIIDISVSIQLQRLYDENKTLEQVNATVSHEMRNPLNSIHSQNLNIKDLIKTLKHLFESGNLKTFKDAKYKVLIFVAEIEESLEVQLSSTKMLTFGVNDMLSLA
jgi:signal transduction histidine kinase